MTSATKTKPKKKTTLSLKALMARVMKHEAAASLIKLAATTGWLTDEATFATKLNEDEQAKVKEVYNASGAYRKVNVAESRLPEKVGQMADESLSRGKVILTAGERTAEVDAQLFLTLKKRHPSAMVYFSPEEDGPIIFSEFSTVALLYR